MAKTKRTQRTIRKAAPPPTPKPKKKVAAPDAVPTNAGGIPKTEKTSPAPKTTAQTPAKILVGIHTEGMERNTFADGFLDYLRDVEVDPKLTAGVGGTAVFGGYILTHERDPALSGRQKYVTYAELHRNLPIIALGVRARLDLGGKPSWSLKPADESKAAIEVAKFVEDVWNSFETSWNAIVRRALMFKFYGFSIHEWTAKDRDDGKIGYLDVEVRPQSTIERWDLDVFGTVSGVIQRSPQTQQYHYIPRGKVMHIADDAETDSPEGLGLFRLSVEVGKRIQRYRTLEGFGFETDLRGVPIAGAPIAELQAMVKNKLITLQQAEDLLKPLSEFMSAHIKSPDSGIMVDSSVYTDIGPIRSPSSVKKWTMELLQGGSTGLEAINTAIAREALWLAALYGIEQLFIGGSSRGSQSLSQDKSKNLATQIDADVSSVGRAAERDLIVPLLKMNGIDLKLKPKLEAEKVQWREIEEVTGALQQVAVAGAPLMPDDPAIPQIRALLGLKSPDPKKMAIDATLNRSAMGPKPPPGGGGGPPKPPGANGGFTPPPVAKSDLVLIKR